MQVFHFAFSAMGSPCQLQFYASSAPYAQTVFTRVLHVIAALEHRYSRYRADSLISQINQRAGSGQVTPMQAELFALLAYADSCYQESDGLFDVTSGVLRKVWHVEQNLIPSAAEIESLLGLIGWPKVQWDAEGIYLPLAGMQLDFGGIVKEYAADAAANACASMHISAGIIELGGDIRIIGPRPDGTGWPVAIRDPRQPDSGVASLELKHGALASSGDYERFQEIAGVRYSHLLNPKTGWPVSGLRAASVVAEHCVVAGSIATIAMLQADHGNEWLAASGLPYLSCCQNGNIINRLCVEL